MLYQSVNPFTGETYRTFPLINNIELDSVLDRAQIAYENWKTSPISYRVDRIHELKQVLIKRKDQLALVITKEMGKPITQSRAEIEKCILLCDYYAEQGPGFLEPEYHSTKATETSVRFDPLGCILMVMPWNFPFWQVFRCAIPSILAGNTMILKHAPNVPQCSLQMVSLFEEAGFPIGSFQQIFASKDQIKEIIAHEVIQGLALTGSDRAGSELAKLAGEQIKPCVLELGGSDPFIVLNDADVEQAAWFAAKSRLNNAGQTCIAAKRFLVEEGVYDQFQETLRKQFETLKIQNPLEADSQLSCLARPDLVKNLNRQVQESMEMGAKKLVSGGPVKGKPCFYKPEILVDVSPNMPVMKEEVFGPVAVLEQVKNVQTAIKRANQTVYGLGAAIWTADLQKARTLAPQIDTGFVAVNGMVRSSPELPFGGVKRSGYGRELGKAGIRAFTNMKTVVLY